MDELEIVDIAHHLIDRDRFVGWSLDRPLVGSRHAAEKLIIIGWAIARGQRVEAVEVYHGERILRRLPLRPELSTARPDLQTAFADVPTEQAIGFNFHCVVTHIGDAPTFVVTVRVVLEDGTSTEMAALTLRRDTITVDDGAEVSRRLLAVVSLVLPRGAQLAVVGTERYSNQAFGGRDATWLPPLPPPPTVNDLIRTVRLKAPSATYLVFAPSGALWLAGHRELRDALLGLFRLVADRPGLCVIFALHESTGDRGADDAVITQTGTHGRLVATFEAEPHDVVSDIAPDDQMFFSGPTSYFRIGAAALRVIQLALLAGGKTGVENILDLPCGHGRVLRYLKAAFPDAALTACDIDRDGVDYCARVLGATPIYSTEEPSEIELPGRYDLIWVGSLVTHLPAARWHELLALFERSLAPGGVLVLTTAGRTVAERIRGGLDRPGLTPEAVVGLLEDYDRDGFGYRDYPLSPGYGISLASMTWVLNCLGQHPLFASRWLFETSWGLQDVIVGRRATT